MGKVGRLKGQDAGKGPGRLGPAFEVPHDQIEQAIGLTAFAPTRPGIAVLEEARIKTAVAQFKTQPLLPTPLMLPRHRNRVGLARRVFGQESMSSIQGPLANVYGRAPRLVELVRQHPLRGRSMPGTKREWAHSPVISVNRKGTQMGQLEQAKVNETPSLTRQSRHGAATFGSPKAPRHPAEAGRKGPPASWTRSRSRHARQGHGTGPDARHRHCWTRTAPEPGCGSGAGYQFMASAMARSNASNGSPPW